MVELEKVSGVLPPPKKNEVDEFESFYRVLLPGDYKDFLKKFNGAKPLDLTITINNNEKVIERFLSISENPNDYSISVVITQIEDRLTSNTDLLGAELIPFAALFAGDFLCLDFRKNKNAGVVLWDHEMSGEFSPALCDVSASFTEFLQLTNHKF